MLLKTLASILLFSFSIPLSSQTTQVNHTSKQVFALIIGISKYSETGIPELQFADRDATIFADYLKSKAGGIVPDDNIRLLTNDKATTAAVYDAVYWLTTVCKKDDLVYFYFSGHGDVENSTMYKNGFLICYDSPPNNYVRQSLSIDYLNDIANTLSVQTQANVVLITDACRSGKLAGSNFKGNYLVGEQLRAVKNKEVRITSSAADQLSNEMEDWGGGRGVFSYYLINGLKGLGDVQKDGVVTLSEVKTYLDSSFSRDAVLKRENITQTPVLNGRSDFILSKVDLAATEVAQIEVAQSNELASTKVSSTVPELTKSLTASEQFFNILQKVGVEAVTKEIELDGLDDTLITSATIFALTNISYNNDERSFLNDFQQNDLKNLSTLKRFKTELGRTFADVSQQIINKYLESDEAELERRRYYNSASQGYDVFVKMLDIAIKLTDPKNKRLVDALWIKRHYFAGVVARLKIPLTAHPEVLIAEAFTEQQKALALEENAAYIFNEIGILYKYKKNYVQAEKNFIKATELSPTWAVPWSNLIGLYSIVGKFEKGLAAFNEAYKLNQKLQTIYVNYALLQEKQNNYLLAEQFYRKSIYLNSRHYLPFERLGFVYMSVANYALADSFFKESEIRKMGYHLESDVDADGVSANISILPPTIPCNLDTQLIGKNDAIGHFAWGKKIMNEDNVEAEKHFKISIRIDSLSPLAYHYLGQLFYAQQRWQEAELAFKLAKTRYLSAENFERYCDSIVKIKGMSDSCIYFIFKGSYYNRLDNLFFLGDIYEKWNHVDEAVAEYNLAISSAPNMYAGYYKLWKLLENVGRYNDAERVINNYYFKIDEALGQNEVVAFYERMILRYPEIADWYYAKGSFLYHLAKLHPEQYENDRKVMRPDSHEEMYANRVVETSEGPGMYTGIPGTNEMVYYAETILQPRTDALLMLLKADSMSVNEIMVGDANNKIGDLYCQMGLHEKAIPYYKKYSELQPSNASTRMKLVETYTTVYLLKEAQTELDSLYARKEINYNQQLLLAQMNIHAALYKKGLLLLNEAEKHNLLPSLEITDLRGRSFMLSGNYKAAIKEYEQLTSRNPLDACYTMARLSAKRGNTIQSFKWLEKSFANGFKFSHVLKKDSFFNELRFKDKWKTLLAKHNL